MFWFSVCLLVHHNCKIWTFFLGQVVSDKRICVGRMISRRSIIVCESSRYVSVGINMNMCVIGICTNTCASDCACVFVLIHMLVCVGMHACLKCTFKIVFKKWMCMFVYLGPVDLSFFCMRLECVQWKVHVITYGSVYLNNCFVKRKQHDHTNTAMLNS